MNEPRRGKLIAAKSGQKTDEYDSEDRPIWAWSAKKRNGRTVPVCGAKTRSGNPCQRTDRGRSGRCVGRHNGNALIGAASPTAKTLRHSKLPDHMRGRYGALHASPDKGTLEPEITLIQTHIDELEETLSEGGGAVALEEIRQAWYAWQEAMGADDPGANALFEKLKHLIIHGVKDEQIWRTIANYVEVERRLVESEEKRKERAREMMPRSLLSSLALLTTDVITGAIKGAGNLNEYPEAQRRAEKLTRQIQVDLESTGMFDAGTIDTVMRRVSPMISGAYISTARQILSDISRGIGARLPTGPTNQAADDVPMTSDRIQ
ncbi:MAG TPA: hypothetical protein VI756_14975 [Blastocatellia bacterium]